MGRKRKQGPPCRTRRICVRVTDDLYEVIAKNAAGARMPVSEYVRTVLTGRTPKVHYELVYNDPKILQIFHNLAACGNNLNQIAWHLNSGGVITNQIWKDMKSCISELYVMRDELRKLVGEYRGSALIECAAKYREERQNE